MYTKRPRSALSGALAGLLIPVALIAQDPQPKPAAQGQEVDLRVQLQPIGEAGVTGTAVIEEAGARAEEPQEMAAEPLRIVFDLRGLEADQRVDVVIHEGPCETGTTTVARLGSVTADAEGRVSETKAVEDENAVDILRGMEPGTYHLQVQVGGTPLACGNFEPVDGS